MRALSVMVMTVLCALGAARGQVEYEITAEAQPMDGGMVMGDGLYFQGDPVSLWAFPNGGYSFVHWTENGVVVSDQETFEFIAAGNRHLVAHFAAETFRLAYFAAAGGSIEGPELQWVAYGGDGEPVTAVPDAGHHFSHWSDWFWDGAVRQDFFVMENIEVTAHFAPNHPASQ